MKVVINGSTGMIGLALINLLKKDNEIIAIVRPNSKNRNKILCNNNVSIIECGLDNLLSLEKKIEKADIFFHLAWDGTYGINSRNNADIQVNNIKYTLDAVKLAYKIGCSSFVGAGSQAEYGIKEEKLKPNLPVNPITGYGISKFAAGKLSRLLANELGIKHCWARILSVYGPGEKHTLVGSCINSILNNKPFDTTDGNQIWDYIYSEDCAKALYEIAINGKNNKTYLVASGESKTLKEYILMIKDAIDPDYQIGFGNREYNQDQVMYLSADISDLLIDTNFKVTTSFEEGIKKTIEWFKNSY